MTDNEKGRASAATPTRPAETNAADQAALISTDDCTTRRKGEQEVIELEKN